MNYSSFLVGKFPNTPLTMEFIKEARKALRGSGAGFWPRGRNPDRKQFYGQQCERFPGGGVPKHPFQHDLPLEHATELAVYFKPCRNKENGGYHINLNMARRTVAAVARSDRRFVGILDRLSF